MRLEVSGKQKEGKRMANVFGATSTTEDVSSGVNLQGKRILVTGVSAGIGVETARSLAAHGAQVVGAARDLAKETLEPMVEASSSLRSISPVLQVQEPVPTSCLRRVNPLTS
jgi:3-oxoacyl-ACP reductase-like protein